MKKLFIAIVFIIFIFPVYSKAQDDHDHDHSNEKSHEIEKTDHEHAENKTHEHEEESSQVGPDKGILIASEEDGIKLSSEAEKNFEIKRAKVLLASAVEIPRTAIITAGTEVNIYRYRNGFYKRIDFETLQKTNGRMSIKSKELKIGDEIVISGLGFLRVAEIAAFGGAPEGHSH